MRLEFKTDERGRHVATATVTGDYALHVEREAEGSFRLYQRSLAGGRFAACSGLPAHIAGGWWRVLDWAFGHGVYPIEVMMESESPVTLATLRQGGEAMEVDPKTEGEI